jgi:hypothetical protein
MENNETQESQKYGQCVQRIKQRLLLRCHVGAVWWRPSQDRRLQEFSPSEEVSDSNEHRCQIYSNEKLSVATTFILERYPARQIVKEKRVIHACLLAIGNRSWQTYLLSHLLQLPLNTNR